MKITYNKNIDNFQASHHKPEHPLFINPKRGRTWQERCAMASIAFIGAPLAYYTYTHANLTPIYDLTNRHFTDLTNKHTFDTSIGPFAENIGIPFARSSCYTAAMFLGAQKVVQGVVALGTQLVPVGEDLRGKVNNAFNRHLTRDVCLVLGLVGTGLLLEGLESDLNLYLQQLEIKDKALTHLMNGNFTECYNRLYNALFAEDKRVSNISINTHQDTCSSFLHLEEYKIKLQPFFQTAIHSLKRMRLTTLKSHSVLETKFGLPLSRMGFSGDKEFSAITKFFTETDFNQILTNVKNCNTMECITRSVNTLANTLNETYVSTMKFCEDPMQYATNHLSGILNQTMVFRHYTKFNDAIKDYNSFRNDSPA